MSKRDKETTMGGPKGSFETTRWTQIQKAKTHDQERRQISVNNLLRKYWKPVYCYLKHKGYSNEDAKDLTQGFFHEIVLGRELIQQADQTKGRFRTFLLTALDRYVTSMYRKETAKKRRPERGVAQLENVELSGVQLGESKTTPELAFHYTWATSLLDEVLAKVRDEYCGTDRAAYWEVFQATVVAPIFDNTEAPSLTELCDKYGIESEKKASNMAITVKRRFATALRNHLRQFVGSDSEVDDEFRALVEILSEGGAA
jgi:RNA polymerase sigma-70 factor (ECF subfamily)